jgi:arsenate reductase (thioredoxin)
MKRVIFACVHNAGRSQMAAAFFNQLADRSVVEAVSAGTDPGPQVHPEVQQVMSELGIDLSNASPQKLTDELASRAHLLVTMGCGEQCPYVAGLKVEDWPLPDPKGQDLDTVRRIRDDVRSRVENLLSRQGWTEPGRAAT